MLVQAFHAGEVGEGMEARAEGGIGRPQGRARGGPAKGFRVLHLAPLFGLVAIAAVVAGSASAWHTNPACANGSFNQTWEDAVDGDYLIAGLFNITDDCILIKSNVTVGPMSQVHFDDTRVVFANNITNITVHLSPGSVWEMKGNSRLEVWVVANQSASFVFETRPLSNVYINDTVIVGGGTNGNNLSNLSGLYFEGLNDFAWNRVTHTTFANGLLLVNYTKPLRSDGYQVNVGVFGLYLKDVGNATFVNFTSTTSTGALVNDSYNISFLRPTSTSGTSSLLFNRVTQLTVQDATSTNHNTFGLRLTGVMNASLARLKLTPPLGRASSYGVQIESCANVTLVDSELSNHVVADLYILGGTRFLNATNLTIRGGAAGRGIWIVEAGSALVPNLFWFSVVTITSKGTGVLIDGPAGVVFEATSISSTQGRGLETSNCADLRFSNGSIQLAASDGAFLSGGNLTIDHSTFQGNGAAAVLLGDSSFVIDHVTFQGNGRSIYTAGAIQLLGPSAVTNSTVPATALFDAVNLTLASSTFSGRLLVLNDSFTNPNLAPAQVWGLRLDGFSKVEVYNSTFFGLPIAIFRSTNLIASGNVHRLSLLPLNAVLILFDNGTSITVFGETFLSNPPPAGIGTVIRAPYLGALANLSDMHLPRADFGVWVTGVPGAALPASATVRNVTLEARKDALTLSSLSQVLIDRVMVDLSTNAVIAVGAGFGEDLSVRNATLQASGTGVALAADTSGRVTVTDIQFNGTGALPARGITVQGADSVTLARIALDRIAVGINVTDAKRIFLTQQNFTNNTVGFFMNVTTAMGSAVNWTVDTPTVLRNSFVRLAGEITLLGADLLIDNATVSVIGIAAQLKATRFFVPGADLLSIVNGASVVTEPGSGTRIAPTRFTIELSPTARIALAGSSPSRPVLLEGLGDPAGSEASQRGILLQSTDLVVANVEFANSSTPFFVEGVNLTVVDCLFTGGAGAGFAVTVWSGGSVTLSNVTSVDMEGVDATDADVLVDHSTFIPAGRILLLHNSRASMSDVSTAYAHSVVEAYTGSTATVRRTTIDVVYAAAFIARDCSAVAVYDSWLNDATTDADAANCGSVGFTDTFVNRTLPDGSHAYKALSASLGTFTVNWTLQFAVCVMSSGENVTGANVTVTEKQGAVVFEGQSQGSGFTAPYMLLEFESRNGAETYHAPIQVSGSVGASTNVTSFIIARGGLLRVCLDDLSPEIYITSPPPLGGKTRADTYELDAVAIDGESGLAIGYPCVAFNGGSCKPTANPIRYSGSLREGLNIFRIEAVDRFGNAAVAWFNVTRDTEAPGVPWCSPNETFITRNATEDLVCQLEGDPVNVVFGGVIATGTIDAQQRLHATIPLTDRVNVFQFSVSDALGNIRTHTFSWTLDREPPCLTWGPWTSPPDFVSTWILPVSGTVCGDTASMTFNGQPVALRGGAFGLIWNLTEGANAAEIVLMDFAGNVRQLNFSVVRDTMTNCSIITPTSGITTGDSRITVGGRCDTDVGVTVNDNTPATTQPDGTWSAQVLLHEGRNVINVTGVDPHGARFEGDVVVNYVPGTTSGDASILLIFVLIAAAVFALAFFISRRPRRRAPAELPRPSLGSQKAPPRPRPPTMKLPETPEDMTYRPRPPPPPPPPPPR